MADFRANGLITLTTDFGWREPFVGIMKGVMLARAPDLRFVDMAHEVSAFQPIEAGFWMSRAVRYFAPGALHVAVIDPGVGTPRDLIIALSSGQAILAPDNGLLAPLFARGHVDRVIRVNMTRLVQFGVSDISATFHGRDVFAPLAAEIAAGRCDPSDLGDEVATLNMTGWPPTRARGRRRGRRHRGHRPVRQSHFQRRVGFGDGPGPSHCLRGGPVAAPEAHLRGG